LSKTQQQEEQHNSRRSNTTAGGATQQQEEQHNSRRSNTTAGGATQQQEEQHNSRRSNTHLRQSENSSRQALQQPLRQVLMHAQDFLVMVVVRPAEHAVYAQGVLREAPSEW
jgi:hypothetical protein